jgi:hypothetical protein
VTKPKSNKGETLHMTSLDALQLESIGSTETHAKDADRHHSFKAAKDCIKNSKSSKLYLFQAMQQLSVQRRVL